MPILPQDLRFALRTLRRGRVVSAVAILSFAIGIAGNAVVFSMIHALLFRPVPYPEPDRLFLVGERQSDQPDLAMNALFTSLPTWADLRERSRTLEAWAALNVASVSLSQGDRSVPATVGLVTPGFFHLLGAEPVRGRFFTDREGAPGGPRLAVISQEYWEREVGVENDPLEVVLGLDGESYQVVGVVRAGFEFIVPNLGIWLPLRQDPLTARRDGRGLIALARMAPGVDRAGVEAEVRGLVRELAAEHPEAYRGWTLDPMHWRTEMPDPQSRLYLWLIQGAVFFVLLIACVNIANLLLAWSQDRRGEIALRTALGARRGRIVRQLVRESMILAVAGGAVGLALGWAAIRLIAGRFSAIVASTWHPRLDTSVVLFTVGLTVACGLAFGLVPAIQAFRQDQVGALKAGGGGSSGGRHRNRLGAGLVVAEIALSLVALGGGLILVHGFLEFRGRDTGIDARGILTVRFDVPEWKHDRREEVVLLLDALRGRLAELPGVESAAVVVPLPQNLMVSGDTFAVEGRPSPDGLPARAVPVRATAEYFETFRIPLLDGRFFEDRDRDGPPVAVVSRTLALTRFPGRSAVGERIRFMGESREVVGVAGDVQQLLIPRQGSRFDETVYVPFAQEPLMGGYLALRARDGTAGLVERVHREVGAVDPDVTVHAVMTMEEFANQYMSGMQSFNALLGAFGVLALLLASLGTYGVVAYTVGRRTHEIAVRMAVGARPAELVRMVAWHGVAMGAVGLALGTLILVPTAVVAGDLLDGFGLARPDPLAMVGVGAVLFGVTVLATLVPASRAAATEPAKVLAAE